jgi:hypothetical protein
VTSTKSKKLHTSAKTSRHHSKKISMHKSHKLSMHRSHAKVGSKVSAKPVFTTTKRS